MWNDIYNEITEPTSDDIAAFINNPLYIGLCEHIESKYKVKRTVEYSKCSAQPGWNVKYKRNGKSLCVLYPMQGYFYALVVIGNKEQIDTELNMPTFTQYIQDLNAKTRFLMGGKWLMIEVKDKDIYDDCLKLIDIKANSK